jgi:hypothetical protein
MLEILHHVSFYEFFSFRPSEKGGDIDSRKFDCSFAGVASQACQVINRKVL